MAMAKTGAAINIKKGTVFGATRDAPYSDQIRGGGQRPAYAVRAGSSFGYNNLVVDMLGFSVMKKFGYPLLFDATHALQQPGGLPDAAGGRRADVTSLSLAGLSQGIAGLFIEAHPDPASALCDGPCALRLDRIKPFLEQMKALDTLVKDFRS